MLFFGDIGLLIRAFGAAGQTPNPGLTQLVTGGLLLAVVGIPIALFFWSMGPAEEARNAQREEREARNQK